MSAPEPARPRPRAAGRLVRAALTLYPPAWRARYGDEVRALLDESGGGARAAASLVWHAIPVWVSPPRQLHNGSARMRSSLATTGVAWALLAGLAAIFAQLAQAQPSSQGSTLAQHPVIQWSYWVFDGCLVVSVLAVAVGCGPLWLQMLRTAPRRREQAWLLTPALAAAVFLLIAFAVGHLVGQPRRPIVVPSQLGQVADVSSGGVGPWWFLALVVLGFAAALLAAAGPALALRRLRPDGPVVVWAARAAALAAGTMSLACVVSVVAVIGLYLWAPAEAGYHESWELAVYPPAVLLAGAVAVVSAARGLRPPQPTAAT